MKNQFLLLCLLLCGIRLGAQTDPYDPVKDLQTAVKAYNQLRQYSQDLSSSSITDQNIESINEQVDKGRALLYPIINKESGKIAAAAHYFHTLFYYEKGFMLGMKGRRKESAQTLRSIENDMARYSASSFPLEYQMDEKNFVIKWENFAPTLSEYYVSLSEFARDDKDWPAVLDYAGKANANGHLSNWLKTLNNMWIMDIKTEQKTWDRVMLDAAFAALEAYAGLTEKELKSGGKTVELIPRKAADAIDVTLRANPAFSEQGAVYARAANLFKAQNMQPDYLRFAGSAMREGYRDRGFLSQIVTDAAAAGDKALAIKACDQYAATLAFDDCQGLNTVSDLYQKAGDSGQAAKWKGKSEDCTRKRERAARRANREFGLYAGTYLFPFFRSDWGVVGAIQTRKIYLEASYQVISDHRDRLSDISEASNTPTVNWDGYYTHLAINFFSKKGSRGARPYTGLLLGYNLRNFQPILSGVYEKGGNYFGQYTFNPVENRYIAMINTGVHVYGKLLATNLYFSVGAGYSQFDRGNADFSGDGYQFDHSMLELRKPERYTLMMRAGLTFGLQVGSNNRR